MSEERPHVENLGYLEKTNIVTEMERAYLDYSMSVIVERALPDVRDGLKPVHRRILYAMQDLGLKPEAKYRKSATIVGEVLGKYHPHGDSAVYDSLARMAQWFSVRYTLVNGQGNFGSIDGDNPAAMRYTEAKMDKIAREMLIDIEKDTVDFRDNYDGSRQEPTVLPSRVPQLLINGVSGIAVGMATNIPPHNLREVCLATKELIGNPEVGVEELLEIIQGPDFPTGGEIFDVDHIHQVYATGRGPITTRAKAEIVERGKKGYDIIVSEMTYLTNKSVMIEKMANLVRDKKIEGIKDIRDESDKDGIRLVIELKADAYPQKVLNTLYKMTDLQKTYHVNMLALCDGIEPRTLSLKQVLEYYVDHRRQVVIRKTQYELKQAQDRAHILEGLKKALDFIDQVIALIRGSETKEIAKQGLIEQFALTPVQAQAILDMRLQTLAGLERQKILDELEQLRSLIQELEAILASEEKLKEILLTDLDEVIEKYADERRTKVNRQKLNQFSDMDLVPNEEAIIILTKKGYVKRVDPSEYRSQRRGGVGISGVKTREDDVVSIFLPTMTHTPLLFFTSSGRVLKLKAYEIPQGSRTSKGQSLVNFLQLNQDEVVQSILPLGEENAHYVTIVTKNGMVKKSKQEVYNNVRSGGIIALTLKEGDELVRAVGTSDGDDLFLFSKCGKAIRFPESDLRPMGRTATGVKGMALKEDSIIGMENIYQAHQDGWLLITTENGYGKKSKLYHYKAQKRGGAGVKVSKVTSKTGPVVGARVVNESHEELIAMSQKGNIIKLTLPGDIPTLGRDTQGVKLMKVNKDDTVASIAVTSSQDTEI